MRQRAPDQEPPEIPPERDTHVNPPLTVHVAQIDPQRFPDLGTRLLQPHHASRDRQQASDLVECLQRKP
jgi:hypothetical protein